MYFCFYMKPNLLAMHETPLVVRGNILNVISALEKIDEKLLIWFSHNQINQIKLKTDKCHLLLNAQELNFLKIGNFNIDNSFSEK